MRTKKIVCALMAALMALSAFALGCVKPEEPGEPLVTEHPGYEATPQPTEQTAKVDPGEMLIAAPEKKEYVQSPYAQADSNELEHDYEKYSELFKAWNMAYWDRAEAGRKVASIGGFTAMMTEQLMKQNGGKNVIWSPVNVYLALSMLAEIVDGQTRTEILGLLGMPDIASVRANAACIIAAENNDDGVSASLIANSLWLNKRLGFYEDTLKTLANDYGASSYWGDPADPAFTEALQNWLNENTGGLLEEAAKNVRLDPSTVLAIASTIYFKAAWENEFNKDLTKKEIFHAIGRDIECDFMHTTIDAQDSLYYKGSCFAATCQLLKSGGASVWYLLPDEGVSIEDMLKNGGMDFIDSDHSMASGGKIVNFAVPKLDVSSELDLISTLKALGVTSCFDANAADFSPLTPDSEGIFVDQIKHAARVKTDEEGIEAAAFTTMVMCGSAYIEPQYVDFIADRPFVMVVTGVSDQPLFISVVNNPAE